MHRRTAPPTTAAAGNTGGDGDDDDDSDPPSRRGGRARCAASAAMVTLLVCGIVLESHWNDTPPVAAPPRPALRRAAAAADPAAPLATAAPPRVFVNITAPPPRRPTVAYAITVTKDGHFVDGAAVVSEGARRAMASSRYALALVAIVHPTVSAATRAALAAYGYRVLERDLPFPLDAIEDQEYAALVQSNGCCGERELLKLYAWSLVEYHRVVHLDMDSLPLQNMDELFAGARSLVYTADYNMGYKPHPPVQGGFAVVAPDAAVHAALWALVRKGAYRKGEGWNKSGIGRFWGGATFQGLLPYYFYAVAPPEASAEVDRYNQMVDAAGDPASKVARLAQMPVPNCRANAVETVKNAHFTICQKPWECTGAFHRQQACRALHEKWFEVRRALERSMGGAGAVVAEPCAGGRYVPLRLVGST